MKAGYQAREWQKIGKSENYVSVFIFKNPKGEIRYQAKCNRDKKTISSRLLEDERAAALWLDKALISKGYEALNILVKK